VYFLSRVRPWTEALLWAIQVVLQQQGKIAWQEMEKPFIFSPHFLNSSNFQHFEFMSVKSLMNF